MVFQKFALLPHRTVLANTTYGLSMQGIEQSEAEKRASHWLERVGLAGFEDRFPAQLVRRYAAARRAGARAGHRC